MARNNIIADHPSLCDLVEHQQWQRLQGHFSNVLGIAIRTIHPSRELITSPSWPTGVSTEQAVELLKVGEEIDQLVPPDEPPHEISSISTPLGVTYAAVPIFAAAPHVVAYFLVGPMVIGPREEKAQFRQRVMAMGMDAQAVWNLLLSLKPHGASEPISHTEVRRGRRFSRRANGGPRSATRAASVGRHARFHHEGREEPRRSLDRHRPRRSLPRPPQMP